MFKKLLKHDLGNVGKFAVPILLTLFGITVLGSINSVLLIKTTARMTEESGLLDSISIFSSIFMMLFVFMVISLAAAAGQVVIMVDFYRSLVSDRGYLTFTLPVKPRDILLSKLTSGSIWSIAIGAACLLSASAVIGVMIISGNAEFPGEEEILPKIGASGVWAIILGAIFFAAYFVNSILLYFTAIFFASVITRRNKVAAAIGCVFGVNFIYGIFSSIISTVIMFIAGSYAAITDIFISAIIFFSIGTVLLCAISLIFFFLTKYMMEKKLNLA